MLLGKLHFDRISGSSETLFNIFLQSNMPAEPRDINYSLSPQYPQLMWNMSVKFPLNLCSRSGEEDF